MIGELLRATHAPAWVVFAVVFGLYIGTVGWWLINGYTRELFGSPLPHMGRIHHVVFNFHTGLPVSRKSHGDERKLKKAASNSRVATPDGLMVYFHPWPRWARALRNNLIIMTWLLASCGMALNPSATVRTMTLLFLALIVLWVWRFVARKRAKFLQSHPVSRPAATRSAKAKIILRSDDTTVGETAKLEDETRPQLEGVPQTVLANLLAPKMGCSTDELLRRLTMTADRGEIRLPDSYSAVKRTREEVEEVIEAHTRGKVRFEWKTTDTPRTLAWLPVVVPKLPTTVSILEYLDQIEKLGPRQTGLGVRADRTMYVQSHQGDLPWWCDFMGSGCGKSTKHLVKAAQIAHKDPLARIHCFDTKQVSFEALHGIPGIYIYDNSVTGMEEIWGGLYSLAKLVESRYTAVREKRARLADFHDEWVLVDEGNHLGGKLKNYWTKTLGETSASPAIWADAIAPILQTGRQANVIGEWMFQDLTDRAMGGQSLKFAFSAFCAAGFLPNQFARTIGTPAEECIEGPGKILVCQGNKRVWTQGFHGDEQWLHDYALENRKGRSYEAA